MDTNDIEKDVTYLSIHDVPYLVVGIYDETVRYRHVGPGGGKDCQMPLERFAAAMKSARR